MIVLLSLIALSAEPVSHRFPGSCAIDNRPPVRCTIGYDQAANSNIASLTFDIPEVHHSSFTGSLEEGRKFEVTLLSTAHGDDMPVESGECSLTGRTFNCDAEIFGRLLKVTAIAD